LSLLILATIMLAGCVFLGYFSIALWREQYPARSRRKAEITQLPPLWPLKTHKAGLLHIPGPGEDQSPSRRTGSFRDEKWAAPHRLWRH